MKNFAKWYQWIWQTTAMLKFNNKSIKIYRTSKTLESTINLIDAVKIILYWILSKLAFPYRSKSVKAVSESFKMLTLITLRSSKRVLQILL